MTLLVYTNSASFEKHLSTQLPQGFDSISGLSALSVNDQRLHLIHAASFPGQVAKWLKRELSTKPAKVMVCADNPQIVEMLELVELGIKAYCNSYMRSQHFEQMIDLVDRGQSWFPPAMLQDTFALARQAVTLPDTDRILSGLTDREKQTAIAVSNGLSNRAIADQFQISERTVKTHLTNIFKKLDISDRVALVLMLKDR